MYTRYFRQYYKLLENRVQYSQPLVWEDLRVRINGEYLKNLRIADDIVLFSNSGDALQQMIEDLNRDS